MRSGARRRTHLAALLMPCLGLLGACATTREARHVHPAGHLIADPALLQPGNGDEPTLYYLNPGADWKSVRSILVDPVLIWRGADSGIHVSEADAQQMANYFHQALVAALSPDLPVVTEPTAGSVRLTAMITELDKTRVVLNVISTVEPHLRVLTGLEGLATGKPLFTGEVGMAYKMTNAQTGELLSAGVDERVGTKHLKDSWKTWHNVEAALRYWAALIRYDLCEHRGVAACTPPTPEKSF